MLSAVKVSYDEVGVESTNNGGLIGNELLPEGMHWNPSPGKSIKTFTRRRIHFLIDDLVIHAKSGGTGTVDVTVNAFLPVDSVDQIKAFYSLHGDNFKTRMDQVVLGIVLNEALGFTLEQFLSPARKEFQRNVVERVFATLKAEGLLVDSVNVRNVAVSLELEDIKIRQALQDLRLGVIEAQNRLYAVTNETQLMLQALMNTMDNEVIRRQTQINVTIAAIRQQQQVIEAETDQALEEMDANWRAELATSLSEGRQEVAGVESEVAAINKASAAAVEAIHAAAEAQVRVALAAAAVAEQESEVQMQTIQQRRALYVSATDQILQQMDAAWRAELVQSQSAGREEIAAIEGTKTSIIKAAEAAVASIASQSSRHLEQVRTEADLQVQQIETQVAAVEAEGAVVEASRSGERDTATLAATSRDNATVAMAEADAVVSVSLAVHNVQGTWQERRGVSLTELHSAGGDVGALQIGQTLAARLPDVLDVRTALQSSTTSNVTASV